LKENRELSFQLAQAREEAKNKLKKREAKLEELRTQVRDLERQLNDMKSLKEEAEGKVLQLRMKTESRVQEKEFKIITLENQIQIMQQQMMISQGVANQMGLLGPNFGVAQRMYN
jgi:chromosome segregation ATPase